MSSDHPSVTPGSLSSHPQRHRGPACPAPRPRAPPRLGRPARSTSRRAG